MQHFIFLILICLNFLLMACERQMKFVETSVAPSLAEESANNVLPSHNQAIQVLKPALAIRGGACISCHATVASNIITDFGYNGDDKGLNYFGGMGLKDDVYGDVQATGLTSWQSLSLTESIFKVIVPKTSTFTSKSLLSANSLKDYFKQISPSLTIDEVSSVFIGAPTASRLQNLFQTKGSSKYLSDSGEILNGLTLESNSYYKIAGDMNCDGDLFIDKPLFIKDLQLKTIKGCRIYATKSVFIQGAVNYVGSLSSQNLQISSSRAIVMGVGLSQLRDRMSRGSEFFTRTTSSENGNTLSEQVQSQNNKIIHEAGLIQELKDATLYPADGSRKTVFKRLLLNAPQIHSRYLGDFDGIIIAEFALMSLGQFHYKFDPVFSNVPVLPMLQPFDYLKVGE